MASIKLLRYSAPRTIFVVITAFSLLSLTTLSCSADQLDRLSWLERTAARPAGMGGAFTAVPGDPAGMFYNPSAAMRSSRLSISGSHSLRHFPGPKRNLDQFDSDVVGATLPLAGNNVLGFGFTVPGEWGVDYSDTNGLLKRDGNSAERPERLRARERFAALADVHAARHGLGSTEFGSSWNRAENADRTHISKGFVQDGGFSFFYQGRDGFSYGINIKLKKSKRSNREDMPRLRADVKLGAAYRADPQADTLAALDLEFFSAGRGHVDWRYFAGLERKHKDNAFARIGLMDGETTYGLGARFSHLRLDYAVVRGLLPRVSGENPGSFGDGHFLSYTLTK